ncbi:MAG: hypothetical protein WC346_06805 [Methanogenium sp.]|jgi:hypothetical protein
MKKETLLKKIEKIRKEGGYGLQSLFEKDYDGSCPCFDGKFIVDSKPNEVWGRCWRVSKNAQDLHFFGDIEIGKAIKRCLDTQEWHNEYTLIIHKKPFLETNTKI